MKLGLLILLLIAVLLWFGHAKKRQRNERKQSGTAGDTGPSKPPRPEAIVGCSHCGLHVPISDAFVSSSGASFCCEAHRRLHPDA